MITFLFIHVLVSQADCFMLNLRVFLRAVNMRVLMFLMEVFSCKKLELTYNGFGHQPTLPLNSL